MNEVPQLVHLNENEDTPTVSGRALHQALEIKTPYTQWFDRMCEYGFTENTDFLTFHKIVKRADGAEMPKPQTDHQLTIDMAKELCMIQRSEIGKKCRQYFIEIEKQWNSPEAVLARALKMANAKLQDSDQKIKHLETAVRGQKAYIRDLEPKAQYCENVLRSDNLTTVTEIAKDYGMTAVELNAYLKENGIQFKRGGKWYLYAPYAKKGYAAYKTVGEDSFSTHLCWTQKGKLFIYQLLKMDGILPVTERGVNV